MKITPELWQDIHSPAVLEVHGCAGVWVDLDSEPPPYTGLVLNLKFPDLPSSFTVLYRMTPEVALRLACELISHASAPIE